METIKLSQKSERIVSLSLVNLTSVGFIMRKVLAIVLSCLMLTSVLAGCGSDEIKNTEKDLVILMYLGGYGVDGMKAIAKDFEAENADKGYSVTIVPNAQLVMNGVYNQLRLGPKLETSDIFFGGGVNYRTILREGSKFVKQDYNGEYALEELTDMYNSKVYGEDTLYKEKINQSFYQSNTTDGKQYSSNWASGITGLMYNNKHFSDNGWSIPATTNELNELAADMKSKGYAPFNWANNASYWEYISLVWWRQLATDEEADNFWQCIDSYGEESSEVLKSYARLQSYNLVESYVSVASGNSAKNAMTTTHIQSQASVMKDSNKVCMMPSGDWVENEMKNIDITGDVGLMRAPVASEVLYVDGDTSSFRFNTVKTEAKLREVIKAIDAGAQTLANVSEDDFKAIAKIRSFNMSEGFPSQIYIPAFSNAKELAKEFLLFMASDKSLQTYFDVTGCTLPFNSTKVDTSKKASKIQQDAMKINNTSSFVSEYQSDNPLYYMTELGYNNWQYYMEKRMGTTGQDLLTGKGWYDYIYGYFNDNFANYQALVNIE